MRCFAKIVPQWLRRSYHIERLRRDGVVLSGPFQGMRFAGGTLGYVPYSMWLGTHEKELHAVIEAACRKPFARIINVGAAEGYYAVGMAMRIPEAVVHAFETLPEGQRAIQEIARRNGVDNRIQVHGYCDSAALAEQISGDAPTLIICDVEGYEDELLLPEAVPALAKCAILCEVHDLFVPGLSARLKERFSRTHTVAEIQPTLRAPADLPRMGFCKNWWLRGKLLGAADEKRGAPLSWLWMQPRSSQVNTVET